LELDVNITMEYKFINLKLNFYKVLNSTESKINYYPNPLYSIGGVVLIGTF